MVCYQTFCWNFHRSLQTVIPLHNPGCEAAASTRNELWERRGATCLLHATQEGRSRAGNTTQTFASPSVHYTFKCHLLVSSPHQYISPILPFLFSVNKVFERAAEKQTASNAFRKGRREWWMQHEGSTVHGWDSHAFSWVSAHRPVRCESRQVNISFLKPGISVFKQWFCSTELHTLLSRTLTMCKRTCESILNRNVICCF